MVGVRVLVDDRANNLEVGYALLADLPRLILAATTETRFGEQRWGGMNAPEAGLIVEK